MYHGIINIYKEKGRTSHDVVARLRGILRQKKIGHTGTLDPDAQGVLPVCLGRATKVCDMLTDKDKTYEAVMVLGIETDTQDLSGEVLNRKEVSVTEEEVREVILSFVGNYAQIPPMYSAIKVDGAKLCNLARAGITVERKAREVIIHSIDILAIDLPRVTMRVNCSKGTYIRTLCHDIGEKLGCYGCMESLLRTRVSQFEIQDALTLKQVTKLVEEGRLQEHIVKTDDLFLQYPAFVDDGKNDALLDNGNEFYPYGKVFDGPIRVYKKDGTFIGIYRFHTRRKRYTPIKVFYSKLDD